MSLDQSPIELTSKDTQLLELYIGTTSDRHNELYVRSTYRGQLVEHEIGYLVPYGLTTNKEQAIRLLRENYPNLSRKSATAVHLFCRAFPETSKQLSRRYTENLWPGEPVDDLRNPFEELNLRP